MDCDLTPNERDNRMKSRHPFAAAFLRRAGVVAGSIALLLSGMAGTANAGESKSAWCAVSHAGANNCANDDHGKDAAFAFWVHHRDQMCIRDTLKDGHSVAVVVWPAGHPDRKTEVWNNKGVNRSNCVTWSGLPDNAKYVFKACIGEWSTYPWNRDIIDCGMNRVFRA